MSESYLTPANLRVVSNFAQERMSEIVNIQYTLLSFDPICLVPKAMNADESKLRIPRQPFLWPVMVRIR